MDDEFSLKVLREIDSLKQDGYERDKETRVMDIRDGESISDGLDLIKGGDLWRGNPCE